MTPTIPHVLLSVHGNLPGGETWSCGLRSLAYADPLGDTKGIALAVAASNAWRVLANTPTVGILFGNYSVSSAQATIDGTTVRRVNEDGITVEQYEGSPTTALSIVTGSGIVPWPNQCSVVATLVTARAGRTGKGRIYLPALGSMSLTADRISSASTTAIANGVKALIETLNAALVTATAAGNAVAVQSAKASQEPGVWTPGAPSGYMGAKVVSVRVGDVVDTQRRRRSSIGEAYSTAQVA